MSPASHQQGVATARECRRRGRSTPLLAELCPFESPAFFCFLQKGKETR